MISLAQLLCVKVESINFDSGPGVVLVASSSKISLDRYGTGFSYDWQCN